MASNSMKSIDGFVEVEGGVNLVWWVSVKEDRENHFFFLNFYLLAWKKGKERERESEGGEEEMEKQGSWGLFGSRES